VILLLGVLDFLDVASSFLLKSIAGRSTGSSLPGKGGVPNDTRTFSHRLFSLITFLDKGGRGRGLLQTSPVPPSFPLFFEVCSLPPHPPNDVFHTSFFFENFSDKGASS